MSRPQQHQQRGATRMDTQGKNNAFLSFTFLTDLKPKLRAPRYKKFRVFVVASV